MIQNIFINKHNNMKTLKTEIKQNSQYKSGIQSLKVITILFFALTFSLSTWAWDAVGHRIIGEIAYQNLNRKVRKQCDRVLGERGIVYQATWPDEVRSDKQYDYSYKWHYQNLKDGMTKVDLENLLANPLLEGEHLFYAINTMKDRLKKNKNDEEALKFLVHFVGDLHQPMHLGRLDDLGGNKVIMKWFGKETNIHAVWDGQITDSKNMSYTEYSKYLIDKYEPQLKEYKKYSILQSVEKAYEIRTRIYNYDDPKNSNYLYVYTFGKDVDEMLFRAGIQLANQLNAVFK